LKASVGCRRLLGTVELVIFGLGVFVRDESIFGLGVFARDVLIFGFGVLPNDGLIFGLGVFAFDRPTLRLDADFDRSGLGFCDFLRLESLVIPEQAAIASGARREYPGCRRFGTSSAAIQPPTKQMASQFRTQR
jgi:hypothetical protein